MALAKPTKRHRRGSEAGTSRSPGRTTKTARSRAPSPAAASAGATGQAIRAGRLTNAGANETNLVSTVPGDKATLAIHNRIEAEPGTSGPRPDGLRVFAAPLAGPSGAGAAIQAFGGQGTFSVAPQGGIGVRATGTFTGVIGLSQSQSPTVPGQEPGSGVYGEGKIGVRGKAQDGTGVQGESGSGAGVFGKGKPGVHGEAGGYSDTGVVGESISGLQDQGVGVRGSANVGIGVLATTSGGIALEARGPVKFKSAGLATILNNSSTSGPFSPGVAITPDSKVLCTLQSTGGTLLNVIRNPAGNTITINLTANATGTVTAAWFVIS